MHVRAQARALAKAALEAQGDFAERVANISQQKQVDTKAGAWALIAVPSEPAELMTTGGSYQRQIDLQIVIMARKGASETLEDEIDRLSVLVETAVLGMDPDRSLAHRIGYTGAEIDTQTGGTEDDGDAILSFVVITSTPKNNPEQAEV